MGDNQNAKSIAFIVDGKTIKEIDLEAEALPKKVSIPVNYGLQLKIIRTNNDDGYSLSQSLGVGSITIH